MGLTLLGIELGVFIREATKLFLAIILSFLGFG